MIRQGIAIDIDRAAAVERDRVAVGAGGVWSGVGDRRRVPGRYGNRVRRARRYAVADDEAEYSRLPRRSAVNDGLTAAAFTSVAALPAGVDSNDHSKVRGSPSASVDPLPSRSTTVLRATVWSLPAFAIGALFD